MCVCVCVFVCISPCLYVHKTIIPDELGNSENRFCIQLKEIDYLYEFRLQKQNKKQNISSILPVAGGNNVVLE